MKFKVGDKVRILFEINDVNDHRSEAIKSGKVKSSIGEIGTIATIYEKLRNKKFLDKREYGFSVIDLPAECYLDTIILGKMTCDIFEEDQMELVDPIFSLINENFNLIKKNITELKQENTILKEENQKLTDEIKLLKMNNFWIKQI